MARRMFIPGTGGCIFHSSVGQIGSIKDLALNKQHHLEIESDPNSDILKPIRSSGIKLPNGGCAEAKAKGVIRAVYPYFKSSVGPTKYEFWDYDWRLDMRYNGHLLIEKLRASGKKWDIVCHSQGGLVLIWASKLASAREFQSLVRRVIFLGVPIQGTMNAASGLIDGVNLIPGVKVKPEVVRTWPSVYQMLPRWKIGLPTQVTQELFMDKTWREAGLLTSSNAPDYSVGINPDILKRGRAWKSEMNGHNYSQLLSIERWIIFEGVNYPTWVKAPQFPTLPSKNNLLKDIVERGDGLVPADLTFALLPQVVRNANVPIYHRGQKHMSIANSLQVFNFCESQFV